MVSYPHSITCNGKDIREAFARLRPCYPKRDRAGEARVLLWTADDGVRLGIPGGEIALDAEARGVPFAVSIPYKLFRDLLREEFGAKERISFDFDQGLIRFRGVTMSGVGIHLGQVNDVRLDALQPPAPPPDQLSPDPPAEPLHPLFNRPIDSLENEPMGRVYCHFRFAPPGTAPSTLTLIRLYDDATRRVRRAATALGPLGVSRDDLDQFLRARYGPRS